MLGWLAADDITFGDLVVELHLGLAGNNLQIVFLFQAFQQHICLRHGLVDHVQHLSRVLSGADPDFNGQVVALAVASLCGTLPDNDSLRVFVVELAALLYQDEDIFYLSQIGGLLRRVAHHRGHRVGLGLLGLLLEGV